MYKLYCLNSENFISIESIWNIKGSGRVKVRFVETETKDEVF